MTEDVVSPVDGPTDDAATDDPIDRAETRHTAFMAAHEEELAERRTAAITAGRRKGGVAGAAMAGAMLALSEIIEGPPKDHGAVTVDAASDPEDLELDGVHLSVEGVDVEAPPLDRLDPVTDRRRPG